MNTFKRGTLFDFTGVAKDENNAPFNLAGHTVEAQLRTWVHGRVQTLIAHLDTDLLEDTGHYRVFKVDADTREWPLGKAAFDIVFVTPGGDRLPTLGYVLLEILDPATQEEDAP